MDDSKIDIVISSQLGTRAGQSLTLSTRDFAKNVEDFIQKMSEVLSTVPDTVGENFELSEFTVSAELSKSGGLKLSGSGIEAASSGGITFTFTKKAS